MLLKMMMIKWDFCVQTIPNLSHITIGTTITEKSNFLQMQQYLGTTEWKKRENWGKITKSRDLAIEIGRLWKEME